MTALIVWLAAECWADGGGPAEVVEDMLDDHVLPVEGDLPRGH